MTRPRRILRFWRIAAIVIAPMSCAACGSSTSTATAPSGIERCGVTLGAAGATVPAEGGTGRITLTTARECAWTAASEAPWLSIVGSANGQGDGSIEYRVVANGDPVTRRAAIVANNQRAEVTQAAGTCAIDLRQPSGSFPPEGGTGRIEIVASSQMCSWTADSSEEWITIAPPRTGTGNGIVTFVVAPTTGPPRTGVVAVAGQRFSVTQSQGCTYSIAPVGAELGSAGGSGTISVAAAAGCPWTAFSNEPWIAVTAGASGQGAASIQYSVTPTDGPQRTGSLVVAGQPFTVTQGSGCVFEATQLAHAVPSSGGTLTINVTAAPACAWAAATAAPWITIVGAASGSGSAAVTLAVAPSSGPARNGTVTIAGQTVTVAQAEGCTFAISPESASIPAGGGRGSVTVTAPGGCGWTASSNAQWIAITDGVSGSGGGTVQFSVAATTGAARSGTLTIAGRTFTIDQGSGCAFTLSPPSADVQANGGPVNFDIQTDAACAWTVVSNASWITVLSDASGAGSRQLLLSVAPNTSNPRAGTVSVSGATFTVNQQGGCSFTLSASSMDVAAGGASPSVDVTGDPACTWTATSAQDWIAITSAASGTGNGRVDFTVAPNAGPARSGQLLVGGRTLTVNQAAGCTFAIAPQDQSVGAAGGDVVVNVTGPAACSWTAVSGAWWIAVASGASRSGNDTVQLTVAPNADAARTGTVTIAGLVFTVNQASGCTYALGPPARSADAAGGPDSFSVDTGNSCPWAATADVPWIRITAGSTGVGPGKVDYILDPNPGAPRTGTVTVQGTTFTVNQAGI